jgi:hypothetical protein
VAAVVARGLVRRVFAAWRRLLEERWWKTQLGAREREVAALEARIRGYEKRPVSVSRRGRGQAAGGDGRGWQARGRHKGLRGACRKAAWGHAPQLLVFARSPLPRAHPKVIQRRRLRALLAEWRACAGARRQGRARLARAVAHDALRRQRAAWRVWVEVVEASARRRVLLAKAARRTNAAALAKAWAAWRRWPGGSAGGRALARGGSWSRGQPRVANRSCRPPDFGTLLPAPAPQTRGGRAPPSSRRRPPPLCASRRRARGARGAAGRRGTRRSVPWSAAGSGPRWWAGMGARSQAAACQLDPHEVQPVWGVMRRIMCHGPAPDR